MRRSLLFALAVCACPLVASAQDAVAEEAAAPDQGTEAIATEEPSEPPRVDAPIAREREPSPVDASLGEAIRERERLRPWHVIFGTAAGLSTSLTTLLGYLHFSDRYGWDGDPANTGCMRGDPILGTELCTGPPWPHAIAAIAATTFFGAAFTIALFMPDPLHASEGSSEHATLLTIHKTLRWVLLGLFVGQVVLGAVSANIDADFGTNRGIALAHLVVGTTGWATMVTQGMLGSIMEW